MAHVARGKQHRALRRVVLTIGVAVLPLVITPAVAAAQDPPIAPSSVATAQTPSVEQGPGAAAICIGIVLPSVQGVDGSATAVATAVRDLFASYLTGPSLQPVAVDARIPSQALAEARQKQCSLVLTATLTRKHSGVGNRVFGQMVGQVIGSTAYQIPGAGTVAGSVVQSVAVASGQAISTLAATTTAKDEIRLEYKLSSADGKTQLGPTTDKAKAATDGEDLLTPLVERAAEAIVARIAPR